MSARLPACKEDARGWELLSTALADTRCVGKHSAPCRWHTWRHTMVGLSDGIIHLYHKMQLTYELGEARVLSQLCQVGVLPHNLDNSRRNPGETPAVSRMTQA